MSRWLCLPCCALALSTSFITAIPRTTIPPLPAPHQLPRAPHGRQLTQHTVLLMVKLLHVQAPPLLLRSRHKRARGPPIPTQTTLWRKDIFSASPAPRPSASAHPTKPASHRTALPSRPPLHRQSALARSPRESHNELVEGRAVWVRVSLPGVCARLSFIFACNYECVANRSAASWCSSSRRIGMALHVSNSCCSDRRLCECASCAW
jgi:hypothetical protein